MYLLRETSSLLKSACQTQIAQAGVSQINPRFHRKSVALNLKLTNKIPMLAIELLQTSCYSLSSQTQPLQYYPIPMFNLNFTKPK